ncbi:MAG: hypothetical protein K2M80_07470, partial [Muribaculaceae bacterium]|nr:hypothetical protein [Muribaculaceae bacterium]
NTDRWANFLNNTSRREDQQTITAKLGLTAQTPSNGRFVPATENDIYGWGLDCSSVVSANITSGRVSGGKIYFPKAGYYEGEEKKSQMHTMLWSRTYLGGTQGLDPVKSNEYGYWYRYFDDMKSSNPENRYSNIRLARGSNGSAAVLGSSIYRYMPLRLVWVNSDCQNPYYSGNDDNNVVTGKIVVYVKNESQWTDVYYHVWGVSPGATTWGSLPKMTKVEGQTNLWRCEFGVPLSNRQDAGIMFGSRTNPGDNDGSKSGESKELYTRYNRGETVFYFTLKSNLALELTDSSDQDIYQNQNNTEYNYYILGTSSTFFTADNSQRKALVKSGSNYVLSEMACEASTFMIEVRDKATDAYVKVLRGTISSGNVNLGTQMDVTDKSTADGATNWKLPTADAYTFTFNPQTMKLRVNRIGVSNDYDYYLHGVPVGGWTENNLLKFKFNTTTKVYEIKDATLVSGEFGIRVCTLNDANKTKQDWLYSPNSSLTPIVVNTAMPVVSEQATSGKNWNLT